MSRLGKEIAILKTKKVMEGNLIFLPKQIEFRSIHLEGFYDTYNIHKITEQ